MLESEGLGVFRWIYVFRGVLLGPATMARLWCMNVNVCTRVCVGLFTCGRICGLKYRGERGAL